MPMTPLPKFKPFMAYLDPGVYKDMKAFSKRKRTPMSQLVREAIHARIASGDVYTAAFNAGLKAAMQSALEKISHLFRLIPALKYFPGILAMAPLPLQVLTFMLKQGSSVFLWQQPKRDARIRSPD